MSEPKAVYKTSNLVLTSPVPAGATVTQTFAEHEKRRRQNGWKCYNGGVDWAVPTGTPIKAAAVGTITKAGYDGTGYGVHVRIQHGSDYLTLYGHLASFCVRIGQHVEAGEVIGHSDNTGNSTGPHLHFELRKNNVPVDPEPLLAAVPVATTTGEPATVSGDAPAGIPVDMEFVGAVSSLRLRSGPVTNYDVLGWAGEGNRVRVKRLHCNPVWAELEDGSFCAVQIGDDVFLQPVE